MHFQQRLTGVSKVETQQRHDFAVGDLARDQREHHLPRRRRDDNAHCVRPVIETAAEQTLLTERRRLKVIDFPPHWVEFLNRDGRVGHGMPQHAGEPFGCPCLLHSEPEHRKQPAPVGELRTIRLPARLHGLREFRSGRGLAGQRAKP